MRDAMPPHIQDDWSLGREGHEPETTVRKAISGTPSHSSHSIRTILVPLDGTAVAEHALPHAIAIARRCGATLRLLDVCPPGPIRDSWGRYGDDLLSELHRKQLHRRQSNLEGIARRIGRRDDIPVVSILAESDQGLAHIARLAEHADLIVMATERGGAWSWFWHRHVTKDLVRRLTKPLLLVPGFPSPVDLTGDPIPRHILLPLNGLPEVERIIGPASALGRAAGATISLLRVSNGKRSPPFQAPADYLREIAGRLKGSAHAIGLDVWYSDQRVATAIQEFASEQGVDLVALTTHDRHGLSRLTHISQYESLLRHSKLPLLLLNSNDAPPSGGGP
jgi:nucleotide-binding universal stress UspA family protein